MLDIISTFQIVSTKTGECHSAREVRAREITWMTADRTRRDQPRGRGRDTEGKEESMDASQENDEVKRRKAA